VIGVIVCGLVRDRGRAIQAGLWDRWGGSPTVRRLRWRDSSGVAATQRLHDRVNAVLSERLPDATEEIDDPTDADQRYEEAVAAIRTRTRDTERFHLVFEENVDYGFRRNALGLRPIAIAIAGLVLVFSLTLFAFGGGGNASRLVRWGTTGVLSFLMLLYWWRVVSEEWCRRSAELYADRLLEAVELLERNPS
jgi:hypothetical protein